MTAGVSPRQRLGAAALLGAIAAFGQAPYDLPIVMLVAFVGAIWLFDGVSRARSAAVYGWAFGTGYFAHALQWIVSPFLVDVARHGWMAPFAVVLMAAGLALFWGMAFWMARSLSRRQVWPLLLCLPAVEVLRAYVFTGFPWAMPAQALIETPLAPALAWVGPHGANIAAMALALLPVAALKMAPPHRRFPAVGIAMLSVLAIMMLPHRPPEATLTNHTVRLIQPNATQRDKWDPDKVQIFYERQLRFTAAAPDADSARPDLILWPESAVPWYLHDADPILDDIAQAAGPAMVGLGIRRVEGRRLYNAMVAFGPDMAARQLYDKHHLVPFGEYVPFGDLLGRFGISGLAARNGFGYSAGPGAAVMDFGPLGKALPLICYEAVFAHDVGAAPVRPAFLIQITNDGWFGKAAGPRQHLAQARMRAIEQGLPLARAANTGISAMIDPYGRVTKALPLNTAGFVDAHLPAPLPPTLYARTGDLPIVALLMLALLAAGVARFRR